ncbi:MAG: AraC family transcriptional regulator [Paenibacillaceae bacterium]|jgi:AraC-like DNA-binding protein|nr:AraC family transcriptional regulator [Paenibacillaceae bacterium]
MINEIRNRQVELAKLIERHLYQNSFMETAIPSLFFIQFNNSTGKAYRIYQPSLCFVAQGRKEIYLANQRYEYGPADYLVTSMNLPIKGQVIKASPDIPYLSLKLEFSQKEILGVLQDTEIQISPHEHAERALFVGQIELSLLDALLRLVRLLDTPGDIPFLSPIYTKEILYRLLKGHYGVALAQSALEGSGSYRVHAAIEQIMGNFDKPLRIDELAETANMSLSSFHRHFKEVTAMSPIQFQKQLRLQEARRLLLTESENAAEVAFRVGYESSSQFTREYARMFGFPPRTDIKRLKEKYDQKQTL